MVSVTYRLPTCLQNPPDAVDGLAADVAGGGVLSPVVQRPPVVYHLDGAIGPLGGAEQGGVNTRAGSRVAVDQERRPRGRALVVAGAVALGIGVEHVEGHALGVDQDVAEVGGRDGDRSRSHGIVA